MTIKQATRPIAAYAETRAADDGEFTRRFVASTSGVKRDGLDIDLDGMRTENFMRNPVFLWVHDYWGERAPIGKVTKIRMKGPKASKRMAIEVLFDAADEFAMTILRKYDEGFLNAVSIGWDILEWDRDSRKITESDLLDVSAVPVPGDADALMERQRSLMRDLGQSLIDQFADEQLEDAAGNELRVSDFGATIKCPECDRAIDDGDTYAVVKVSDDPEVTVAHCTECALKISDEVGQLRGGLPSERPKAKQHNTQEGDQMERLEALVKTLDAFRSALSDFIDVASVDDTDESLAALLGAFPTDKPADDGGGKDDD